MLRLRCWLKRRKPTQRREVDEFNIGLSLYGVLVLSLYITMDEVFTDCEV